MIPGPKSLLLVSTLVATSVLSSAGTLPDPNAPAACWHFDEAGGRTTAEA